MYEQRINTYILYYFNISHYDNSSSSSSSSSKSNNINSINNQLQRIMFLQTNNILHIVAEVLDSWLYCSYCAYVVPVVCCVLLTAVEAGSTCSLNSFIQLHLFVFPFYLDFMLFVFLFFLFFRYSVKCCSNCSVFNFVLFQFLFFFFFLFSLHLFNFQLLVLQWHSICIVVYTNICFQFH